MIRVPMHEDTATKSPVPSVCERDQALVQIGQCADRFREECGLMGVWNHGEASNLCYLGLYAQQHRGQEGAGVVSVEGRGDAAEFYVHRGLGLVADVFGGFDFLRLPGQRAIGHVRYSTAGGNQVANVQPFFAEFAGGRMAIAHNGNLINADKIRDALLDDGAIFSATSDTELLLHLIARAPKTLPFVERIITALHSVEGAYSLLMMTSEALYAVRDPNGFRPLVLGKLGNGYVLASETCAFDLVGASYLRDVECGELVVISGNDEPQSFFPFKARRPAPCIFEYVYFARPDSEVFGANVYETRKKFGEELAREHPVKADLVIPVPDSGTTAAIGFSQASGIPLEMGLIRNHYVGRTFIEPKQSIRDFGVKVKLNANPAVLAGKSIVVVDDSLVRGTTSKKLVAMLRQAGAREVHLRISSPPTTGPCYYGIDTPEKEQLIASHKSVEEIAAFIEVNSLAYLSVEGLYRAVAATQRPSNGPSNGKFCDACFSGHYPIGTPQRFERKQQEMFGKQP